MIKYIDCDGVILDTETHLFDGYEELKKINPDLRKRDYLANLDWKSLIDRAEVINDAINILKGYDPSDINILTKIHSLQEARAKVDYFRRVGVKNIIIFVTPEFKKSDVVRADRSILVDDSLDNLNDWYENDGIPIHFSPFSYSKYPTVYSLEKVLDDSILEEPMVKRLMNNQK